ncbi:MAG: hypothetical protein LC799_30115, partial [Actinobacteria bacterium]|nr:hypothetical protein [Actinomycetota bacterium]
TSSLYNTCSGGDRVRTRAYFQDFWLGIVGYVLVLSAVLVWGDLDGHSGWRYLWALLPVVPAGWVVRALVRHVRRIDDYQRRLLFEALGAAFGVAMIASLTVGFLGIADLTLSASAAGWLIYSLGMLTWLVVANLNARNR